MQLIGQQLRDQVRTFLRIRQARKVAPFDPRAPKPRIGAMIVRGEIRMMVQAGLTDELWVWLGSQGWREPVVSPDRRHYRDIPSVWVTRLFDAPSDQRVKMLTAGVSRATIRHTLDSRFCRAHLARVSRPSIASSRRSA